MVLSEKNRPVTETDYGGQDIGEGKHDGGVLRRQGPRIDVVTGVRKETNSG
jgi:hypothetical protein